MIITSSLSSTNQHTMFQNWIYMQFGVPHKALIWQKWKYTQTNTNKNIYIQTHTYVYTQTHTHTNTNMYTHKYSTKILVILISIFVTFYHRYLVKLFIFDCILIVWALGYCQLTVHMKFTLIRLFSIANGCEWVSMCYCTFIIWFSWTIF